MSRLGEILRAQRERKGITLEQAAEDTRIRQTFLVSLETGDHRALPGAVYTKGFLQNYAEYLDLDPAELVTLYTAERAADPEPRRKFEPMKPVMRSGMYISPTILVPVVVLFAVILFVGYLSYQFASFATPPRIEVYDPAADTLAQSADYTVRGRTVADGRVTIRVFPGPETIADIRPASDGTFSAVVKLRPGPNHIEVQVLDATGKVSQISRTVRFEVLAQPSPSGDPAPQVVIDLPQQGQTFTNTDVPISGRVEAGVTSVTVNGAPLTIGTDGRFTDRIWHPAGTHSLRFVARTAAGAEVSDTRTITVGFTSAVVTVRVQGGDAWLLAQVDGAVVAGTGRVYANGSIVTFPPGRQVTVRTGNAGATTLIYNGQLVGRMGETGQVAERTFTYQ